MNRENDNNTSESLFTQGTNLYEQKKFDEAEIKLKKALRLEPASEEIMYNLALVHLEKGEHEKVSELLKKIRHINCDDILNELKKRGFLVKSESKKGSKGFECIEGTLGIFQLFKKGSSIDKLIKKKDVNGLIKWLISEKIVSSKRVKDTNRALQKIGKPAIPKLVTILKDRKGIKRRWAAEFLGMIGDKSSIEPLIALIQDKETGVSIKVIDALKRIGDERCIKAIVDSLKNPNVDWYAAYQLGEIGGDNAVDPLISTLDSKNHQTRKNAVEALCKIGDKRAFNPLASTLLNDVNPEVRKAAIKSLVKMNGELAIDPLLSAFVKDKHSEVQEAIENALIKIGNPSVEPLKAYLNHENLTLRKSTIRILGKIGTECAVGSLISVLLHDEQPEVRKAVVKALKANPTKMSIETIEEFCKKYDILDQMTLIRNAIEELEIKKVKIGKGKDTQKQIEEGKAYLMKFNLIEEFKIIENDNPTSVRQRLREIEALQPCDPYFWHARLGTFVGPMGPDQANIDCLVETPREVLAIILPRSGKIKWEKLQEAIIAEIYGSISSGDYLKERFVVLKNLDENYFVYLAGVI